jgi:hypothetical protein
MKEEREKIAEERAENQKVMEELLALKAQLAQQNESFKEDNDTEN